MERNKRIVLDIENLYTPEISIEDVSLLPTGEVDGKLTVYFTLSKDGFIDLLEKIASAMEKLPLAEEEVEERIEEWENIRWRLRLESESFD